MKGTFSTQRGSVKAPARCVEGGAGVCWNTVGSPALQCSVDLLYALADPAYDRDAPGVA